MPPRLLTLLAWCFLTSCATIMNGKTSTTTIHVDRPTKLVMKGDTFRTNQREFPLTIKRGKEPFHIVAITDSQYTYITLRPYSSFAYYANIFCNYGIGMLVEKNNPKRYTYPRHLYVDSRDSLHRYKTYYAGHRKGQIQLHISLPHINNFQLQPRGETPKGNTGFWGLTLGLNYYHSNNQFLKLQATGVADLFVPVPAPIDISGEYEMMSSAYAAISNNHHHWKRFTSGYGIAVARNTWDLRYYDRFSAPPPTRTPVLKRDYAVGFLFSSYYYLGKKFGLGLVYRPTIAQISKPAKFAYEHVISFDIAWRIVLKR